MPSKAIISSSLWQMGSQITMAALSIVTIKLVTLGLDIQLAGLYNSAYGYLQIFGILADFGLYAVAVRELSKTDNKEKVLGTLLALRLIIMGISLGSAVIIAWLIPAWMGTPLPMGIALASLVPGFTLAAGMLRASYQVAYKMHLIFIAEVAQRFLTLGLTIALILWGVRHSTDPFVYYLFMSIGGLGALLLLILCFALGKGLPPVRLHWDRELIGKTLKLSAPYGLAFLAMTLYRQIDVTLIALLRPDYALQNAYYGFVQRMMDMAYLLPTFLLNSTLPVLSQRFEKGEDTRELLGKTLLIVLLLGITSLLFSVLWPRPLMLLLTNEQYLSTATSPGSDTALSILSLSMFFNGIVVFCFYSMLTRHAWKPLVKTLLVGAVLSLGLNLALIPTYGFVGAALTSAGIHAFLAICLLPLSMRALPFSLPAWGLSKVIMYGLGLALFLWLVSPILTDSWRTAAALAISAPVMLGLLWGLKLKQVLGGAKGGV